MTTKIDAAAIIARVSELVGTTEFIEVKHDELVAAFRDALAATQVTKAANAVAVRREEVGTLSVFPDNDSTFGFSYDISTNCDGHKRLRSLDGAKLYVGAAPSPTGESLSAANEIEANRQLLKGAIIGLRDGWASKTDVEMALEVLASPPPSVQGVVQEQWLHAAAKWIVRERSDIHKDHACGRCVPDGEIVKPGFACIYHEAVDVLASAPPAPARELTDADIEKIFRQTHDVREPLAADVRFARAIERHLSGATPARKGGA